jgi:ribonuclease HII
MGTPTRERAAELLSLERSLIRRGWRRIAGVDEAGLGPLAGPVVAAAVILPPGEAIPGADDSKKLSAQQRESAFGRIRRRALAIGTGLATVTEIERHNIREAGILAMRRALEDLSTVPDYVLLDARSIPGLPWPQEAHIKGDARIHAIACASVVAKVLRDRLMDRYDLLYPQYGFRRHRGYATREHRAAIVRYGPCPIHRRGFRGAGWQPSIF